MKLMDISDISKQEFDERSDEAQIQHPERKMDKAGCWPSFGDFLGILMLVDRNRLLTTERQKFSALAPSRGLTTINQRQTTIGIGYPYAGMIRFAAL